MLLVEVCPGLHSRTCMASTMMAFSSHHFPISDTRFLVLENQYPKRTPAKGFSTGQGFKLCERATVYYRCVVITSGGHSFHHHRFNSWFSLLTKVNQLLAWHLWAELLLLLQCPHPA